MESGSHGGELLALTCRLRGVDLAARRSMHAARRSPTISSPRHLGDSAANHGAAVGVDGFEVEFSAAGGLLRGPDAGRDRLAGKHRADKAHAQAPHAARVAA